MGTIAPVILEELQEESKKWEQRQTEETKHKEKPENSNGTPKEEGKSGKTQEKSKENGKIDEADTAAVNNKGSPVPGRKINGNGKEKKLRCEEDPECIDYDYRYSNVELSAADYED